MRKALYAVIATTVALLAGGGVATPAAAGSSTGSVAHCEFTANFVLDPGPVFDAPRTFDFATVDELPSEPGDVLVSCTGKVNGAKVTGPGSYIERGTIYDGTCAQGSGSGSFDAYIPTQKGVQHIKGQFYLQYVVDPTVVPPGRGYEVGPSIYAPGPMGIPVHVMAHRHLPTPGRQPTGRADRRRPAKRTARTFLASQRSTIFTAPMRKRARGVGHAPSMRPNRGVSNQPPQRILRPLSMPRPAPTRQPAPQVRRGIEPRPR